VRAVDPHSGAVLDVGGVGELEAFGPQIMRGYLGRPTEYEAMVRPDGWLRTGDLGYLDAEGNVVIVDRIKDLIKVNGYQVSPTDIEQVLASHPAVAEAAVTGRADERSGEVPVAFVVLRRDVSMNELRAWLVDRLSPYKLPADIHRADALPRTPSGKLLRRRLTIS
jgi:acyl-CoA synthetase (AMP-forming)/AMP-acid ligase II